MPERFNPVIPHPSSSAGSVTPGRTVEAERLNWELPLCLAQVSARFFPRLQLRRS